MAATPTQITRRQTNFFTAVGDLLIGAGGAGTTPTVLPIGGNGTVLTSNGTTAAWSSASTLPTWVDQELLFGNVNGTPTGSASTTYTLAHTPINNPAVKLYLNGQRLTQGTGSSGTFDYTITGAAITLLVSTVAGDTLYADYRYGA